MTNDVPSRVPHAVPLSCDSQKTYGVYKSNFKTGNVEKATDIIIGWRRVSRSVRHALKMKAPLNQAGFVCLHPLRADEVLRRGGARPQMAAAQSLFFNPNQTIL